MRLYAPRRAGDQRTMTMGGSGMGNTAFMGITSLRLLGLGSFVGDIIIGGENSRSQNVCERQSAWGISLFTALHRQLGR